MPHQIRLAGPWEVCRDGQTWQRCVLPWPQTAQDSGPAIQLRRRFHQPTGLDTTSVVTICVTASVCVDTVWLNDRPLSACATQTLADAVTSVFQVTRELAEYNVLMLQAVPEQSTDLPAIHAVVLQIED